MKKIIFTFFLLVPFTLFAFGEKYVVIDIMNISDDLLSNMNYEIIGKRVCKKDRVIVELYPVPNSRDFKVVVACDPVLYEIVDDIMKFKPLSIYTMAEKEALEFISETVGKTDCLEKTGFKDCD